MPTVKLVLKKKGKMRIEKPNRDSGRIMQWHNTVKGLKNGSSSKQAHIYLQCISRQVKRADPSKVPSEASVLLKYSRSKLLSRDTKEPLTDRQAGSNSWLWSMYSNPHTGLPLAMGRERSSEMMDVGQRNEVQMRWDTLGGTWAVQGLLALAVHMPSSSPCIGIPGSTYPVATV